MFTLIRWAFLSCLAITAGVLAVSVPILGKTVAEHIRDISTPYLEEFASRSEEKVRSIGLADLPPPEELTEEDRAALERLLGDRAAAR